MADDQCKVNQSIPAKDASYTEQHAMSVDDVAGHQIRIFELKRTIKDDVANCEGLKQTSSISHETTDYINGNGTLHGYSTIIFENGDKIFTEDYGVSHNIIGADGSRKGIYAGTIKYTGGTGRYVNVRGILRQSVEFDSSKNINDAHTNGEYWFEK